MCHKTVRTLEVQWPLIPVAGNGRSTFSAKQPTIIITSITAAYVCKPQKAGEKTCLAEISTLSVFIPCLY